MTEVLVLKERLRGFYGKNSLIVDYLLRFLLIFTALMLQIRLTGYESHLSRFWVPLLGSMFFALLPVSAAVFLAGLLLLGQFAAVSPEAAVITLGIFLIGVMMLFGFQVKNSWIALLAPVLLYLKLPFALVMAASVSGAMISVVPLSLGILTYYLMLFVKQNINLFSGGEKTERLELAARILRGTFTDRAMLLMLCAVCLAAVVVILFRKLSWNYALMIAAAAGLMTMLGVQVLGSFFLKLKVEPAEIAVTAVLSAVTAVLWFFFAFSGDYSRTEYLQYEDDDYYYYVKAVPKMAVSKTDVKVEKINKIDGRQA